MSAVKAAQAAAQAPPTTLTPYVPLPAFSDTFADQAPTSLPFSDPNDPSHYETASFGTHGPLPASSGPVYACADPFSPLDVLFLDTPTFPCPSCPVCGRADPFSPGIVPFWTHEPLPAPFLDVPTPSCPVLSLFGHTDT